MGWLGRLMGRGRAEGAGGPPPEYFELVEESRRKLAVLTHYHQTAWRFGRHCDWGLDRDARLLRFAFGDGEVVTCSAQAIGSFRADSATWMWAWHNESLAAHPGLLECAGKIRAHGEAHRYPPLVDPTWLTDLETAWTMTALATTLGGAEGAFCGITGPLHMFLAFSEVRLGSIRLEPPDEG